jgi:hypothetical protein
MHPAHANQAATTKRKSLLNGKYLAQIAAVSCAFMGAQSGEASADEALDFPTVSSLEEQLATCAPEGGLELMCGPRTAEDMYDLAGTPWVITSGLDFYYFNIETREWGIVEVDIPNASDGLDLRLCPKVLVPEEQIYHGINGRVNEDESKTLMVISHGGRESVEFLDINDNGDLPPGLTWTGCLPMIENAFSNAVAPIPNGGIVASITLENDDEGALPRLAAGGLTGYAAEWFPATGWRKIEGSALSGNNGVETSPDGQWVYSAGWGNGTLGIVERDPADGAEPISREIELPVDHADNVRWTDEGTLLVTGHNGPAIHTMECQAGDDNVCTIDFVIVEVHPETGEVLREYFFEGGTVFGSASVAMRLNGRYWVGTHKGAAIASFEAN